MDQPSPLPLAPRVLEPLGSNHPWLTAICPIVAVVDQTAIPIGTGFTIATFGLVLTPAVVPVTALNQSKRIGCVLGGVFVPIDQIYTHSYTDFAILQLETGGADAEPFPILPLTLNLPATGMGLLAAGYLGFAKPGTINAANQVAHDWQLCTYRAGVAGVAESPRKKGPSNQLILLPAGAEFEAGMIGGPVFYAQASAVCGAMGQYPSGAQMTAYGMALSPAMGLHVLFPEGAGLTYQCLYDIAKKDQFLSITRLDRLQLFPFDERYSVVVALDKPAAPVKAAAPVTPDSWLLSQGLELGYYMAGGVPIIRYTPSVHGSAMPPATTAAHEKAHMVLMTTTEYGAFISALAMVIQRLAQLQEKNPSEQMAAAYRAVGQAMDQLMKASWLTQEGGATAVEVLSQLNSPAFDLAAMQKALPATYDYALNLLSRIASSLNFPFLPGTESLRYPICMGICSAALNTGIIDHFVHAPTISAAAIIESLSNPANRPDARLLKLAEAAQLNPKLLAPLIPQLLQSIVEKGDVGRKVDRLVQNHLRDLNLFPISPWIDAPAEADSHVRDTIREKLFDACGVDPKDRPIVRWTELAADNIPEQLEFSALDHSQTALAAKDLTPFAPWLKRVRAVKRGDGERLAFSAAPIPHLQTDDRWTCYLSSLTISPGTIKFDRLAIEFDAISEADLITALKQLEAPICATVHAEVMPLIGDKVKRVFTPLGAPLFQYRRSVSLQIIDTLLAAAPYTSARLIPRTFAPNAISCCSQDKTQPRLLWFDSGDSTNLYRGLFEKRGIPLEEGPLDLTATNEDLYTALAGWMCTYGTMGAT